MYGKDTSQIFILRSMYGFPMCVSVVVRATVERLGRDLAGDPKHTVNSVLTC